MRNHTLPASWWIVKFKGGLYCEPTSRSRKSFNAGPYDKTKSTKGTIPITWKVVRFEIKIFFCCDATAPPKLSATHSSSPAQHRSARRPVQGSGVAVLFFMTILSLLLLILF